MIGAGLGDVTSGVDLAVERHNGAFAPRFGRRCQSDGVQQIHRAVRAQAVIGALRAGNNDRLLVLNCQT